MYLSEESRRRNVSRYSDERLVPSEVTDRNESTSELRYRL